MANKLKIIVKPVKDNKKPFSIHYGFVDTPKFGQILIGLLTDEDNAICHLHFVEKDHKEAALKLLHTRWPNSNLVEDSKRAQDVTTVIFGNKDKGREVAVAPTGTKFQLEIWAALVKIPVGSVCTYSEVAEMVAKPKAVRAVANAVASNDVGYLIPCHRIVAKNGNKLKFGWGGELKKKLLNYEGVEI